MNVFSKPSPVSANNNRLYWILSGIKNLKTYDFCFLLQLSDDRIRQIFKQKDISSDLIEIMLSEAKKRHD